MAKIDLCSAFNEHEEIEPEEVAQSVNAFTNVIEEVGVISLILSDNELNQTSAGHIANSFCSLPMLQVLDLNNASLRNGCMIIA